MVPSERLAAASERRGGCWEGFQARDRTRVRASKACRVLLRMRVGTEECSGEEGGVGEFGFWEGGVDVGDERR